MLVTITENGEATTYDVDDPITEHQVKFALSSEVPTAIESVTRQVFAEVTGACLCTSFRYDTLTNKCLDCGHEAHNTGRVYCGGIR